MPHSINLKKPGFPAFFCWKFRNTGHNFIFCHCIIGERIMELTGNSSAYKGLKVLIMGLGLHGGGLESARYLARAGAEVTVTDLRDESILAPSMEKLSGYPIRYVLGRHDMEDFRQADLVVKNPGVRPDSPYLRDVKRIETDISIFLENSPARLLAVTGSKGKSGTSSALHWGLQFARANGKNPLPGKALLGGNITVSPLTFLDSLEKDDDVVLELSSWQLGDLTGRKTRNGRALLKPRVAVLTAIMPDHLDRYGTMEAYVRDKKIIYEGQDKDDLTVASNDSWGREFLGESRGRPMVYSDTPLEKGISGGWLTGPRGPGIARLASGELAEVVPAEIMTPGYHQKKNLLAAALGLLDVGIDPGVIREAMGSFPGIEHRLEFFHESGNIRFYNDTAATIPEAAAAAIEAFDTPLVLVTGGTDKNLNFTPLAVNAKKAKAVILLDGSGSIKLKDLLEENGVPYLGPFSSVDAAVKAALESAGPGDTVLLSPGCASFGMFLNEFDRGRKWKEAVIRLS